MNEDATEAALGLLCLSPSNLTPQSLIPLKRKQSSLSVQIDQHPASSSEAIQCICGFVYDDGFSIACDDCSRWCHAACFDIIEGQVPEEWRCWVCVPRPVDRERAVKLQKARQKQVHDLASRPRASPGIERKPRRASTATIDNVNPKRKRSNAPEDEHVDIDDPYVSITQDIIPHQDTRLKLRRQAQHWRGVTALQPPSSDTTTPVRLPPNTQLPPTTLQPIPDSSFSHPTLSLNTNPSVRPPSYAMHTVAPVPSAHLIAPYTSTIIPSATYLSDPLNAYAHLGMPKPFVHLIGSPLDVTLDSRITGNKSRFVRNGCHPNAVLRPVLCSSKTNKPDSPLTFGIFALRDLKAHEEVVLGWEWDDGNAVHNLPALIESPHMFPWVNDRPRQRQHLRNQMANILHALGSTFTTCACGARARDCALTQMAAFVDGEIGSGERVDLGPLIGVERGFKTREKVPWSGGMSGVEMVTSEHQKAEDTMGDGEEEADPDVDVVLDVDMDSTSESSGRDERGILRHKQLGTISSPTRRHPRPHSRKRTNSSHSADETFTHSRPKKGTEEVGKGSEQDTSESEDKMPPKMRKRWIHRSSETLKAMNARADAWQPRGSASPGGSIEGASYRGKGKAGVGLGIRIVTSSDPDGGVPTQSQGTGVDADVDMDIASGRSNKHQTEMLPPPMPASLDPTTVSSMSPSAGNRPSSTSSFQDHSYASPSASFARLSLLSLSPVTSTASGPPTKPPSSPLQDSDTVMDVLDMNRIHPPERRKLVPSPPTTMQPLDIHTAGSEKPSLTESTHRLPDGNGHEEQPENVLATTSPPQRSEAPQPSLTEESVVQLLLPSLIAASPPDPTPRCPTPPTPRPPTPPPPPKVKMSLKDFAIRKKKQREEEEMAARMNSHTHLATSVDPAPSTVDVRSSTVESSPKTNGRNMDDVETIKGKHEGDSGVFTKIHDNTQVLVGDDCGQSSTSSSNPISSRLSSPLSTRLQNYQPQQNGGVQVYESGSLEKVNSLLVKKEMLDETRVPCGVVAADDEELQVHPESLPQSLNGSNSVPNAPTHVVSSTKPMPHHSRGQSREDGEILPYRSPQPVAALWGTSQFKPAPHLNSSRATPPTQPRSFQAAAPVPSSSSSTSSASPGMYPRSTPASPSTSGPAFAQIQAQGPGKGPNAFLAPQTPPFPPQREFQSQSLHSQANVRVAPPGASTAPRPPPRGPRALMNYGPPPSRLVFVGADGGPGGSPGPPVSQFIPRGPSAGRDRDRDRERMEWDLKDRDRKRERWLAARSRGREGGGSGWGGR